MRIIFVIAILFFCSSCQAQRKYTNRSIAARDSIGFDDTNSGVPTWSGRVWVDDSAGNRVLVHMTQYLFGSLGFDSSSFGSNFVDIPFYGSNSRLIGYIDREGSTNLPTITIDVLDSAHSSGNVQTIATMRALNWTGTKTLAQVGVAADGEGFFSGRRDSGSTFHRFMLIKNDSTGFYIDGVLKWQLTSDGSVAGNTMMRDTNSFTGTAAHDTIRIVGVTSGDRYVATPFGSSTFSITSNDVLGCWAKTDTLIVSRPAGGTSGLGYVYFRQK